MRSTNDEFDKWKTNHNEQRNFFRSKLIEFKFIGLKGIVLNRILNTIKH